MMFQRLIVGEIEVVKIFGFVVFIRMGNYWKLRWLAESHKDT
jgi:hypothetical protein